jgi:hypothetical protein
VDIGVVVKDPRLLETLSVSDKLDYLEKHFEPDGKYPLHSITFFVKSRNRNTVLSFQQSWLKELPWLVYSPLLEGGLCKYCVLFPTKNPKVAPGQLVTTVFQNYRKAKGSDRGILDKHRELQYHKDAMAAGVDFKRHAKKPETTLDYMLSERKRILMDKNKHNLVAIIEAIILCGRQNIPLRGHRDDNTAAPSNRGNIRAILQHTAKYDPMLKEHLEYGKKNAMHFENHSE